MIYPGPWVVLGFVGLVASAVGSSLLALTQTNRFTEWLESLVKSQFGSDAEYAIEILTDGGAVQKDRRGFDELTWLLSFDGIVHRLDLPIDAETQIKALEKGNSNVAEQYVDLTDADGERYEEATTISALEEVVEWEFEKRLAEHQDKITQYCWEILAAGFSMQAVSYAVRNFTA